jgi:O-antigen ligase
MNSKRALNTIKILFLTVNTLLSGMLCWEAGGRGRLMVLALPAACAFCLWRGKFTGHLLAVLGAGLVFFGFQSYSLQAQILHYLVSLCVLLVLARGRSTPEIRPYGPLRLWLLGFVGVMLAGLPLLPLGEFLQAGRELGPLGFARMAAYSVAASSFYALAALDRLVLYSLFAWELSRSRDPDDMENLARGVAASLPAALMFGLVEFFLARGKAFAMNDRLTSLFLNPGWFAEYVCLSFPFLFLLGRKKGKWLLYAILAVTLSAMVLTMARAAWLVTGMLAVGCVVAGYGGFDLFALHYRRMVKGVLLGGATALVVALFVYGGLSVTRVSLLNFPLTTMIKQRLERFTETPRPEVFKSGLLVGLESPVSGMGYETYAWHYPHLMRVPASGLAQGISPQAEVFEATHNLFIQIFAGGGALGLLAWLMLAGRAGQLALRRHRRRADAMSLAVIFSLAAFHAFGIFQEMIYIPPVWLLFFVLLAWCLRVEDSDGGWVADFTQRRAVRAVAVCVLLALGVNLANAGFAATAARLGLTAYPSTADQDLQGFSGPETVDGRPVLWSSGASSFKLSGEGPWTFELGLPHPDLAVDPVRVALSSGGTVLAQAVFAGDGTSGGAGNSEGSVGACDSAAIAGRRGTLTIPADAARPGQRIYLSVSRLYFPLVSGLKDHRALGAWVSGPGLAGLD